MMKVAIERLVQMGFGAVGAVIIILVQGWLSPVPVVVTVDAERLVQAQLASVDLGQLTDAQLVQRATAVGQAVEQALLTMYRDERLIVLSRQSVMTPVPDATELLIQRIREATWPR